MYNTHEDLPTSVVDFVLSVTGESDIKQVPLKDINGFVDDMEECMVMENKLTKEQKEEIIKKFHTVVMDLVEKYDSPETVYLMARALSITAIMKLKKNTMVFLQCKMH